MKKRTLLSLIKDGQRKEIKEMRKGTGKKFGLLNSFDMFNRGKHISKEDQRKRRGVGGRHTEEEKKLFL